METLGEGAFSYCIGLITMEIPDSVTEIGSNPFHQCYALETIYISDDHPVFEVVDDALIDKQEKRLIAHLVASTAEEYDVPEGIVTIGDYAFCHSA